MSVAIIIPARYGSTRFPGKPLALVAGKPMIQRVFEAAMKSDAADMVAVATDDSRIADLIRSVGGTVVMTSPDNLTGTDRVTEATKILGLYDKDIIINLQGDQPLINPQCLGEIVEPLFTQDAGIDMCVLACRIVDKTEVSNPQHAKIVCDSKGFALYTSRGQLPFDYSGVDFDTYKHLGVYACTQGFLEIFRDLPEGVLERVEKLELLRVLEHGYRIRVVLTHYDSPEVDLPEDINRIEGILLENNSKC